MIDTGNAENGHDLCLPQEIITNCIPVATMRQSYLAISQQAIIFTRDMHVVGGWQSVTAF